MQDTPHRLEHDVGARVATAADGGGSAVPRPAQVVPVDREGANRCAADGG
ncbi:hypothetical protein ABT301_14720 [Streptomyces sp. NPDC000987]